MVERTIAWIVADGHRRVPHRGTDRNRLSPAHRAAAFNLERLLALDVSHDGTRWTLPNPT